jgi:hypothetical protein
LDKKYPKPLNIEYLYKEDDGMITIIKENKYAFLVFSDSCKIGLKVDDGKENL